MAFDDKTEAATPRKREEVRKEGRVAKSTDLVSAVGLLASLALLKSAGPWIMSGLSDLFRHSFTHLHSQSVGVDNLSQLAADYGTRFFKLCVPVAIGTAVVGFTANVMQVGLKVTPKAIAPMFNRLDPFKGVARLVSGRSFFEVVKATAKICVVVYFIYSFLKAQYPAIIDIGTMSVQDMAATAGQLCWALMMRGCLAVLVIGVVDYIYQRFSFENSIKMTKQEVKDEYKRTEGNPEVKGQLRARQRAMARRRMVTEVASADFVLTNPTHYAVALKYDAETMSAPAVVAKGQRLLAQKIKEIAAQNGVPVIENPPVARLLYKTVEIGRQVPEELYQTVAEILAYVYQLGKKAGAQAA